jgi:hypothetical protein
VTIADGDEFTSFVFGTGDAGSWTMLFEASEDLMAGAEASVSTVTAGSFENLMMSWELISGTMLETTNVGAGLTSLSTLFTTTPDHLTQNLVLSWTDSVIDRAFIVDVSASTHVISTPLPGSLLLMLTALAGLGAVGLYRRKAPAV